MFNFLKEVRKKRAENLNKKFKEYLRDGDGKFRRKTIFDDPLVREYYEKKALKNGCKITKWKV